MLGFVQEFKNVVDALKLRDDNYIIQTLNSNPYLLKLQDANKDSLFHHAAKEGCSEMIFNYFLRNADAQQQNQDGFYVLHYLAFYNHEMLLAALLKYYPAIDLNIKTHHGDTASYLAAFNGSTQSLQLLIQHQANIHLSNSERQTPLHLACIQGHVDCVILLLAAKARVNATDNQERTPLHYLAQNTTLETSQKNDLLEFFSYFQLALHQKCNNGFTPFQHATALGNFDFAHALSKLTIPTLYKLCIHCISEDVEENQALLHELPQDCQDNLFFHYKLEPTQPEKQTHVAQSSNKKPGIF